MRCGAGTAPCTRLWTRAGANRPACAGRWPTSRCPASPTAASPWRWTSPTGCVPTRTPALTGSSATSTAAAPTAAADQLIPGWPYSFVAALESGRTSWCALLDAVRLGPADDATTVTAAQLREVVTRIIAAGHWSNGDPDMLIVMDAGYDSAYLSHALADLPVVLVGRLRSDRVMLRDAGPARSGPRGGRPRKHGGVLTFAKPESWHTPEITTVTDTTRYGKAEAMAWDRMHPRLTHRGPWLEHTAEELPLLHGTLIRLTVERLPGEAAPKPVWLWCSATGAAPATVDLWWRTFLRRFDIEHTFRMIKQTLGWTAPRVRHPATADLWTWLIIAAHTQLRLARPLTEDLRHPWERPVEDRTAVPGPRPARVSQPPPEGGPSHSRTETGQARPRTPARQPQPAQGPHPGRRQDRETRRNDQGTRTAARLNVKRTSSNPGVIAAQKGCEGCSRTYKLRVASRWKSGPGRRQGPW